MNTVLTVLVLGFGLAFFVALAVRLVLALRRRRRGSSLRDSVLRPILGAGTASVWPTFDPRTSEHLEHVDGGAERRVETSLVEPWPDDDQTLDPILDPIPDPTRDQTSGPSLDQTPDQSRE